MMPLLCGNFTSKLSKDEKTVAVSSLICTVEYICNFKANTCDIVVNSPLKATREENKLRGTETIFTRNYV